MVREFVREGGGFIWCIFDSNTTTNVYVKVPFFSDLVCDIHPLCSRMTDCVSPRRNLQISSFFVVSFLIE